MSIAGTHDIQTIFNPTDQLPYETLAEIFMQCLPAEDLNIIQPHPLWAPMLLCHVCARWRAVALNEPGLWRRVYFSCRYEWNTNIIRRHFYGRTQFTDTMLSSAVTQRNVEPICWWIEIAKALRLPLTIRFELNPRYGRRFSHEKDIPSNVDRVSTIKRALLSGARHLDITWMCAAAFRSHSAIDNPLLDGHHLDTLLIHDEPSRDRLSPTPRAAYASLSAIFPLQQKLPLLRRLALYNSIISHHGYPDNHLSVPWDQLTHVCLSEFTIDLAIWFELIRKFVRLEIGRFHLSLQEASERNINSSQSLPLMLKNLRKLHFTWRASEVRSRILDNVELPSLTHLHIDGYFSIPGLYYILLSTPSVRTLHLGCYAPFLADRGSRFGLTHPHPISQYVPRLRHLVLAMSKRDIIDCEPRYFLESILTCPWLDLPSLDALRHLEFDFVHGAQSTVFPTQIVKKTTINHFADDLKISVRKPSARLLWNVPSSADDLLWSGFDDSDDLCCDFPRVYV